MSASEMVVIIRPSFMKFCHDGCIAAAFNHALYWIAYKAKGQPKEKIQSGEITWYATTEEFTDGLASAWGVCKVRQSVNAMIDMGLIGRGCNIHWKVDRTKHFFFGKDQCKKLLELCKEHDICLLHLGLHTNVLQMINLSNASDIQLQCTCKQMINSSDASIDLSDGPTDSSNASDDFIETIPKDSTKVTSKNIDKGREESDASQEPIDETAHNDSSSSQENILNEEEKGKSIQEKVELFRTTFITLGKEYFQYDKFTASRIQPNSDTYTRILEIIGDSEVSSQSMRVAFLKLWEHKDKDGTHWWRDKSKLTLKAYVNNYDDQDTSSQNSTGQLLNLTHQRLQASTPGSQYIVDEIEDAANEAIEKSALASEEARIRNEEALLARVEAKKLALAQKGL